MRRRGRPNGEAERVLPDQDDSDKQDKKKGTERIRQPESPANGVRGVVLSSHPPP